MGSSSSRRHIPIVENNLSDSEAMVKLLEGGPGDLRDTIQEYWIVIATLPTAARV